MGISPAGIIVKQFRPCLCTKIQVFRLLECACSPGSAGSKSCLAALEKLLMIINTFDNITIFE
jgi:hypothetical protein